MESINSRCDNRYSSENNFKPSSRYNPLTPIIGAILIVFALPLVPGGLWLIAEGGSWYYLIAGTLLLLSGIQLIQRSRLGLWLYLMCFFLTLVWALWEVGLEPWALMPRVLPLLVLLIGVILAARGLTHRSTRFGTPMAMVSAVLLTGVVIGLDAGLDPYPDGSPDVPTDTPVDMLNQPYNSTIGNRQANPAAAARMPAANEDWPVYGGSYHARRHSALAQITRDNVDQLEPVWQYRTGALPVEGDDSNSDYAAETTPLVIDGTMYLCSALSELIALDARTGNEMWRYDPGVSTDSIPYSASCRGVSYFEATDSQTSNAVSGQSCHSRIIAGTLDARLLAVDAQTGQPCQDFGDDSGAPGEVNLLQGLGETEPGFVSVTSPPVIIRGVIITGHQVLDNQRRDAPSGVVRGYDAMTGELAWAWDMGQPELDGMPAPGETYTRGSPNMWTIASGDEALGLVYLPMGNAANDYYGAERSEEENRFSSALVALDAETGDVVWDFQTVHYDVWDYDLGSQATQVDFPVDGGTVPALVLSSKQGDIYIIDAASGESLFPVQERAAPQGGVESTRLSPTQPSSSYHSLAMPDLREKDMWGVMHWDQLWCRIDYRRSSYAGIYTPPTTDARWVQYPGYNGGSDWGGVTVDQQRGILIANYNDMPNHNRLVPREQAQELGVYPIGEEPGGSSGEAAPEGYEPQGGAPYAVDVNAGWRVGFTGLMCKQPRYGGIRAIDLASGETLWDRRLGEARRNGPFGIPSMLPLSIGTPNNGGSVATASGLIFISATTDNLFIAIDIETGETLWRTTLPAGGQATPITYSVDGKQYVTLMAGGHHFMETDIGDYVLTWALPD
ncbi:membrane-bound PQQ-dependent dehydrogenase, glucose/quinate/shikimate family [Pseudohongiella acticola]|uniref:membrane-bound PQQ-dependent dehydrogenase, glucose/quinate/shikimate family n=1 Tax=Pseudohongiella acticola TaxID=1524254 RepID=UPI0030EDFC62